MAAVPLLNTRCHYCASCIIKFLQDFTVFFILWSFFVWLFLFCFFDLYCWNYKHRTRCYVVGSNLWKLWKTGQLSFSTNWVISWAYVMSGDHLNKKSTPVIMALKCTQEAVMCTICMHPSEEEHPNHPVIPHNPSLLWDPNQIWASVHACVCVCVCCWFAVPTVASNN